jgi:hypothetical protein
MSHSEPRQVDLEEYIAEKTGQPPPRQATAAVGNDGYQTIATMYQPLMDVLKAAYAQAASGKGMERHANGKSFTEQPIMEIGRMVGMGYQTGQAMKKAQEAGGMIGRKQFGAARAELLGAINYLAAAYILIQEMESREHVDT